MASTSSVTPDTLVTVKINIEGSNKRFKLPLRDLGAATLPDKLRVLLGILPSSEAIFERYSDSAAAFITLDSDNASVYKQLYRAAKAKLKLRLRVTVIDMPVVPLKPKQATVEDEEVAHAVEQLGNVSYLSLPITQESEPLVKAERTPYTDSMASINEINELQRRVEDIFLSRHRASPPFGHCTIASPTAPLATPTPAAAPVPSSVEVPVTRGAAARDAWYAELASMNAGAKIAVRPDIPLAAHVSGGKVVGVTSYSVYCNKCNSAIPDEHYHCSTCDDGDYDLCKKCVDGGNLCLGESHWMIKRCIINGKVVTSTTETLAPRPVHKNDSKATLVPIETEEFSIPTATRTCNSCIQEFPEEKFVTCTTCDDYDLCVPCHVGLEHGHHPKHAFAPAVEDVELEPLAKALLQPGRNNSHQAVCDGCDKFIYGVRNKCLECPDWDYCSDCMINAKFIHPRHRFVPIYESLSEGTCARAFYSHKPRHHGIYCDGPLCNRGGVTTYIQGDRYKCAVCDDYDLCASCEASPSNTHNKTHPLIKFKTPVRNVSVTTMGDHQSGPMPAMGDRRGRTTSKSTETTPVKSTNAATQVQTVADLKPEELAATAPKAEPVVATTEKAEAPVEEELVAHFVRDTIQDGTLLPANTVFEQTWTLRNGGTRTWPAGCTVKFVGGDNMCAVDPEHPASVHELVSASESTTCYTEVAPGQEFGFTVLMRTPTRSGKVISYWRLTGPTGEKFGHRLWCDVSVSEPAPVKEEEPKTEELKTEHIEHSQMVFPTLEKESPASSIHEPVAETKEAEVESEDDFVEEEFENETEDGFMTDEEWDVLDASDEEYLAEQAKVAKK